jgi:hypothetical protein
MATKTKSSRQDRPRVSSQRHEIDYAARKLGGSRGKARNAVKKAKAGLGRKTSRRAVMRRAKSAM